MTHHHHDHSPPDAKIQGLAHDFEHRVKSGQDASQTFNLEAHKLRQIDGNDQGLNSKLYKRDLQELNRKLQADGYLQPMDLEGEKQNRGRALKHQPQAPGEQQDSGHHSHPKHHSKHHHGKQHRAGAPQTHSPAPEAPAEPPRRPSSELPAPPSADLPTPPEKPKEPNRSPDDPGRPEAPDKVPAVGPPESPQPGSLGHLKDAIQRARNGGAPVGILQLGDSHIFAGTEPATIDKMFKGIAPDVYTTSARNGASMEDALRNPGAWIDAKIGKNKPDLVILSFGSNDSAAAVDKDHYRDRYEQFLKKIKDRLPNTSVLVVGPTDGCSIQGSNKGKLLPGLDAVVAGQREAAAKFKDQGVSFFDQRAAMGGAGSIFQWHKEGKTDSHLLHFTPDGYRELAAKIFEDIKEKLNN